MPPQRKEVELICASITTSIVSQRAESERTMLDDHQVDQPKISAHLLLPSFMPMQLTSRNLSPQPRHDLYPLGVFQSESRCRRWTTESPFECSDVELIAEEGGIECRIVVAIEYRVEALTGLAQTGEERGINSSAGQTERREELVG